MHMPHHLTFRSCLALLFSLMIVVGCLAWPNHLPGHHITTRANPSAMIQTPSNSIDDPEFFVRQNYRDFLNREADAAGLAFWVNNINSCGVDQGCIERKRIDTSAAFFISIEFQQTGYLVYRTYGAAFGTIRVGGAVPLKLREFLPDTRAIGLGVIVNAPGWEQLLESNTRAFFDEFAGRQQFLAAYPAALSAADFVDALNRNTSGSLSPTERNALVSELSANTITRAQALRRVATDADFDAREFNRAFVIMQYFGYLRRNPDDAPEAGINFAGFNFWVGKLNQFNGNFRAAEMVKAFIVSGEFRARFIIGEQVLTSASRSFSSGFEQLQIPGVLEVELAANAQRPAMPFTLGFVSAPEAARFFRDRLRAQGLSPIASDGMIKVSAPQAFPGSMGVRVRVPDEILANLRPGLEPQLYVFISDQTSLEDSGEFVPLDSAYDAGTGMLSAPLTGKYFFETEAAADSPSQVSGVRQPLGTATEMTAEIIVSVEDVGTRTVPVTGSFTTPNSNMVEARVRDTLNISGAFTVKVPVSLQSPVSGTPFVTDGFNPPSHFGIDYRAANGAPVFAAQAGTIVSVTVDEQPGFTRCDPTVRRGGGLTVRIRHADDSVTGYAHLQTGSALSANTQVTAGQMIAQADQTGGTCGPHLHFGYRVGGQRVDPTSFFSSNPQEVEQQWLSKLSFVTSVNGSPVEATRKPVTGRNFNYTAALDLSTLAGIQSGQTYPLVISVQTTDGASMKIYNGKLKVLSTALRAVLTWDKNDTDVDLHVIDSLGRESWYANLCGIPNGCLDNDDINGFGPETFSLPQFQTGLTYRVFLHYFSDHGNGPTASNVKVFVDDSLVTNRTVTLSNNQMVDIGTYPLTQQSPNVFTQDSENSRTFAQPVTLTLRPTDDPDVWEYALPGFPNRFIVRKR